MKIFVLEDDKSTAFTIKECLNDNNGHEVRLAFTVREAIKELESFSPDLVIIDVSLENYDALDIVTFLPKCCRIVVTSALTNAYELIRQNPRVDYFLPKPFDYEHFLRAISI